MISSTPRGFKDIMPKEAQVREELRTKISNVLSLWGYKPIETPTLEALDVLEEGAEIGSEFFRLFDSDSRLLVLRPDITLAIARMVALRLDVPEYAYRFRYRHNVYRESDPLKGEPRELTQLGIELLGADGKLSDAEVITLLIESVKACGLTGFKLALSTVSVLNELLDKAPAGAEFKASVYRAYHDSDYVALDVLINESNLPEDISLALKGLIRVNGGKEAIAKCRDLVNPIIGARALDELEAVWELLEIAEVCEHIVIDFSTMCSFDYYTGFFMELYAPGSGKPIGGGGRYDSLIEKFGKNMPAAGFSIYLERLISALAYSGELSLDKKTVEIVRAENDADTFKKAIELFGSGNPFKIEK